MVLAPRPDRGGYPHSYRARVERRLSGDGRGYHGSFGIIKGLIPARRSTSGCTRRWARRSSRSARSRRPPRSPPVPRTPRSSSRSWCGITSRTGWRTAWLRTGARSRSRPGVTARRPWPTWPRTRRPGDDRGRPRARHPGRAHRGPGHQHGPPGPGLRLLAGRQGQHARGGAEGGAGGPGGLRRRRPDGAAARPGTGTGAGPPVAARPRRLRRGGRRVRARCGGGASYSIPRPVLAKTR